jgi:hypothetical protein
MGDHPFRFVVARAHPVGSLPRYKRWARRARWTHPVGSSSRFSGSRSAFLVFACSLPLIFSVSIPSVARNKSANVSGPHALHASSAQAVQQRQPRQPTKIWTNEDLEQLRERDAISIVGLGPEEPAPNEPAPAQGNPGKKVWTNEDLDKLREQGNISIVPMTEAAPPAPPEAIAPPPAAAAGSAEFVPYDRFQDPAWYAEQAFALHQELDVRKYRLWRYEEGIELAKQRITQPGIDFFGGDIGLTLEGGVQNLLTEVRDVEIRLDDLRELARHNGILPGDLRY